MNTYAEAPAPDIRNDDMHLAAETAAEEVSADEVAIILGFLSHVDIMRARVCKTWRDAATKTLVPLCDFKVDSERSYNAMRVMATALPNLQQIALYNLGEGHKYSDGEDPDERRAATTANYTTHDINIISNFRKLRVLHIEKAPLNGRYPVLFEFPLLRELRVTGYLLKFDLGMLSAGCPSLKSLKLSGNQELAGNLRSLRLLKDTLEEVDVTNCQQIEGGFMDLADFPRLKVLYLWDTHVTGDIRDIHKHDFQALEQLLLPKSVRGGVHYKFQHVSQVPSFMQAIHLLLQRTPTLFNEYLLVRAFSWCLSEDSPDYYGWDDGSGGPFPPFVLRFIQAGSRLGWSWYGSDPWNAEEERLSCEINWLDPEPSSESSGHEAYIEAFQRLEQRIDFYRGYHVPPTEDEYRRLCEEFLRRALP